MNEADANLARTRVDANPNCVVRVGLNPREYTLAAPAPFSALYVHVQPPVSIPGIC